MKRKLDRGRYTHTHTHTQREREKERERAREREKLTDRQTDRQPINNIIIRL